MKLTDIAPISSDVLNTKMKDKLGWNIKTENLSVKDAEAMLESVNGKSSLLSVVAARSMLVRRTQITRAC